MTPGSWLFSLEKGCSGWWDEPLGDCFLLSDAGDLTGLWWWRPFVIAAIIGRKTVDGEQEVMAHSGFANSRRSFVFYLTSFSIMRTTRVEGDKTLKWARQESQALTRSVVPLLRQIPVYADTVSDTVILNTFAFSHSFWFCFTGSRCQWNSVTSPI